MDLTTKLLLFKIINEEVPTPSKYAGSSGDIVAERRLKFTGHLLRMQDGSEAKKVLINSLQ